MERITVSYRRSWDCEGYFTTQSVKISQSLLDKFNLFLAEQRKVLQNKRVWSCSEMDILMYAKDVTNPNRCLTLTQLEFLHLFLHLEGIDTDRLIPGRNTMLIIM